MLYMMLLGKEPFQVLDVKEIDFTLKLPDSLSEEEKDLLKGLLETDPLKRLGSKNGAEELKKHEYFKEVDWEEYKNKKKDGPFKLSSGILQEKLKDPIPLEKVFKEENKYIKFRNFTYVSKSLLDATSKEIKDEENN